MFEVYSDKFSSFTDKFDAKRVIVESLRAKFDTKRVIVVSLRAKFNAKRVIVVSLRAKFNAKKVIVESLSTKLDTKRVINDSRNIKIKIITNHIFIKSKILKFLKNNIIRIIFLDFFNFNFILKKTTQVFLSNKNRLQTSIKKNILNN